ncbi:hypothetical protein HYS91_01570 [Candidatus Daviesbacteria bacterium]|nr:hypothetical protein [Candidatus Daviesbacteria bacterium]
MNEQMMDIAYTADTLARSAWSLARSGEKNTLGGVLEFEGVANELVKSLAIRIGDLLDSVGVVGSNPVLDEARERWKLIADPEAVLDDERELARTAAGTEVGKRPKIEGAPKHPGIGWEFPIAGTGQDVKSSMEETLLPGSEK